MAAAPDKLQAGSKREGNVENTYVLGAAESDTVDARDADEVELLEGLAGLLLVAGVDYGSRSSRKVGLTLALLNVRLVAVLLGLSGRTLGIVVGKLFNAGVRHFG